MGVVLLDLSRSHLALWESRRGRPRALRLANTARAACDVSEEGEMVKEIDDWLSERGSLTQAARR